ncbi:MAG: preprotein translocase subunit SecG [Myxococcota bacterium]|nr:preprotein translocase subunit SecG [Myxococcota bacterium]
MYTLFVVLHVLFCIFLVLVILLQTGKGGGMGTAFGGASQSVFGPRGAGSFIGKLTGIVAGLFMLSSLVLAYQSSSGDSGIADKVNALNDVASGPAEEVDLSEPAEPAAAEAETSPTEKTAGQDAAPVETDKEPATPPASPKEPSQAAEPLPKTPPEAAQNPNNE